MAHALAVHVRQRASYVQANLQQVLLRVQTQRAEHGGAREASTQCRTLHAAQV
jgi:hypothetical protein